MDDKKAVIIVDDDESLLTLLRTMFLADGYRCETATSAETALELIRKSSFDIMLTDITLPGMRGFELTEQAKKIRHNMAVIVMTGFIDDFSYDSAIEVGASDFIKKPFTLKELRARIEHVIMHEKQRVMSVTDDLTGLYNRRGFFALAEQQLKLAKRLGKGIFVLYADVDDLKGINDTLGHQQGDKALVDAATILKTTYRQSDIIARIGGDEFVVAPIGTTGDKIEKLTSRLVENLESHNIGGDRPYRLSISYGVAYYDPESDCSTGELLSRAEKLMYEHKKLKRSRSS